MFEFIRTHKRLMQIFLMLLILPSLVLVGVSSYQGGGDAANAVANVDGKKITQQEWEEAQRQQLDRYRQMLGDRFDPKMFETPEARQSILDNLVAERALDAEIARSHLTVNDATLAQAIANIDVFKKADGSFDMEQYKAVLASQGMSPSMFDARMRRDIAMQQLNASVQSSAFVPRTVSKRLSDINDQEREVQELVFPIGEFIPQVKVTDEMVKSFYDKNAAMFQVPEQVKVQYVVLNADAVESQVSVSDAEVAEFYNKNQKRYGTDEKRIASHILVNAPKNATSAEKASARQKAEGILAEVRKSPADFAKIAKEKSQDPGSAEMGGDLGVVEKGAFVASVEDAINRLKQGEISGVVESEFGYHIITVTRVVPAAVKSLDEVKGEIAAELKKAKMAKKFSELAEVFSDTVYEQSDSLQPVADKLKLKVETVNNLSRNPAPELGDVPYNHAKFLQAVFSDDALKNKRNTEAVEVAPSTLVAGRVVEYKPAAKRPLAEVDALIRQRVTIEEAAKLAQKAGEAKMAAVKASGDASAFSEAKIVSRAKPPAINPKAAAEVLKADVTKLPAYVGVEVPGQGYGVYRIGKVSMPAQPDPARRAAEAEQIAAAVGQQEMFGFIEALKQKSKAKILVSQPAKAEAAN